jgi:hypothetical protein
MEPCIYHALPRDLCAGDHLMDGWLDLMSRTQAHVGFRRYGQLPFKLIRHLNVDLIPCCNYQSEQTEWQFELIANMIICTLDLRKTHNQGACIVTGAA